ncbi:hypothetical protein [Caenispirillum bisanense]|uniref:hypothetical protein n=1 Tax=Caenispirillum bisanense TaxID=414052 RepID=UPI0031E061BE
MFCRYFRYAQREEDIVLDALVWKTEKIRTQLGSVGQVIEERLTNRLAEVGIERGRAKALADFIRDADDEERLARAREEMDDEERARHERLLKDLDDLRKVLERSRERVGVEPRELVQVVGTALARAGKRLDEARAGSVGPVDIFRFDPQDPAFADDPAWAEVFDDLRDRRRKRGERPGDWRRASQVRAIAFEPPIKPDGSDAAGVVQVHLEHRLVRRLLSRFLSQGFQTGLQRVCAAMGPGAQPRVVMLGRLSVYGPGAVRLHEEFIPVTAIWTEAARDSKALKALGSRGEKTTMDQLEAALREGRSVSASVLERIRAFARKDALDLEPELANRAKERLATVARDLAARGEEEAKSLLQLLQAQKGRIQKSVDTYDPNQLALPGIAEDERKQRERDHRHWGVRLHEIEAEIREEPQRSAMAIP